MALTRKDKFTKVVRNRLGGNFHNITFSSSRITVYTNRALTADQLENLKGIFSADKFYFQYTYKCQVNTMQAGILALKFEHPIMAFYQ